MTYPRTRAFRDYDKVKEAVTDASSVKEALARMGYTGRVHKYYPMLKEACEVFKLHYPIAVPAKKVKTTLGRYSVFNDPSAINRAVRGATSRSQILDNLGVCTAHKNYKALEKAADKFSISLPDKRKMNYPSTRKGSSNYGFFDKETFTQAVESSSSGREVLRKLGVERDRDWLNRAAEFHNVKLPVGSPGSNKSRNTGKPLNQVLVENSTYNPYRLKLRLIRDGILANVCSECGLTPEWNGKPLSLQLDHINGVHNDHRLDNLRLVCPNCHSQSSTYAGKNKKAR